MTIRPKLQVEKVIETGLCITTFLKEIRIARGWSQQELADALQINQATVAKMEARKFSVGLDKLIEWMTSLGVTIKFRVDDLELTYETTQAAFDLEERQRKNKSAHK